MATGINGSFGILILCLRFWRHSRPEVRTLLSDVDSHQTNENLDDYARDQWRHDDVVEAMLTDLGLEE